MKTSITTSALILALAAANVAHASDWTGHSSLFLGSKDIEEKNWAKDDEHGAIAVITDFRKTNWPVSIAVDLYGTGSERTESGDKFETYTAEAHLGLRKVFKIKEDCRIRPYIGGGIALVNVEQKDRINGIQRSQEADDSGHWVGVGAYVEVTPTFTMGLDVRRSDAQVTLFGEAVDVSGTTAGITAGYQW